MPTQFNIDTTIAQLGGNAIDTGTYLKATSDQGSIEFDITGTQLDLYCYSGYQATNLNIAVDGVVQTKPTVGIGVGNVGWVTVASGLTDARHTVKVWADYGVGSIFIAKTNGVQITGAAPALQKSPFWGPTLLVDSTQFRTYCDTTLELETNGTYKGFYTSPTVLTAAHMDATRQAFSGVIAFRVTGATYIRIWAIAASQTNLMDPANPDTDYSPSSVAPTTNPRWITLASALTPSGNPKEYWIVTQKNQQIYAIQTDGAFDTTAAVPTRKRHHGIGDSTMICDTALTDMNGVVGRGWLPRVCAREGVLFRNWGIDGTKVTDVWNGTTGIGPIPTVVALASEISAMWTNYGINDYGAGTLNTTFEGNYEAFLNYLLTNIPNAPIRVADMFDIPSGQNTVNVNPHLLTIVSTVNSPLVKNHHWSGYTWNTANTTLGGDTTDGTHQNISGSIKMETSAVSTLTITSGTITGDAAPTASSVTNTWTSSTGGYASIFTYQMQRSAHGAGSWSNITGATSSPATDSTVAAATSYDYRLITTETATGRTTTSNTATVTTAASGPTISSASDNSNGTITTVVLGATGYTLGAGNCSITGTANTITLSNLAISGANLTMNCDPPIRQTDASPVFNWGADFLRDSSNTSISAGNVSITNNSSVTAVPWYVSASGSDSNSGTSNTTPFLALSHAASTSISGDPIVILAPSDSTFDLGTNQLVLKGNLTVSGSGNVTILSQCPITTGVAIRNANNTALSGFTLTCNRTDNVQQAPFGASNNDPEVSNVTISNVTAFGNGDAIYLSKSNSSFTFNNCHLSSAFDVVGVNFSPTNSTIVLNNCTLIADWNLRPAGYTGGGIYARGVSMSPTANVTVNLNLCNITAQNASDTNSALVTYGANNNIHATNCNLTGAIYDIEANAGNMTISDCNYNTGRTLGNFTLSPLTLDHITISPSPISVPPGGTTTPTATGWDAQNFPLGPQPGILWSRTSGTTASVNSSTGQITATSSTGTNVMNAANGSISANVTVNVVVPSGGFGVYPAIFNTVNGIHPAVSPAVLSPVG